MGHGSETDTTDGDIRRAVAGPPPSGEKARRLDVVWHEELAGENVPRARVRAWIEAGRALVDGVVERRPGRKLKGGERLDIAPEIHDPGIQPEPDDLCLLYHDDHLAVIAKPAGLTTHPAPGREGGTLANRLLHHFPGVAKLDRLRPGIVHRLDKDTSGVMLAALTAPAKNRLSEDFAARRIKKTYLALVHGVPDEAKSPILLPIGRDPAHKTKMAAGIKGGRTAVTRFKIVWTAPEGEASLLEVDLETGRTHQIRAHMAALGHPLIGDALYGPRQQAEWRRRGPAGKLAKRQMLHAWKLAFRHPEDGREMAFACPPPKDFWRLPLIVSRRAQRVGVVGLPGSGKSALCAILAGRGHACLSADQVVSDLYEPGRDGHALLTSRYGDRFLTAEGRLDKRAIFRAILASEVVRREIMDLVHPLVEHAVREFWRGNARARLAFVEAPLLQEAGWARRDLFDIIVCVEADPKARRERLAGRPGWDAAMAAAVDGWHYPEDKKRKGCHLVVRNLGDLPELAREADDLLAQLRRIRVAERGTLLAFLRGRGHAPRNGNKDR